MSLMTRPWGNSWNGWDHLPYGDSLIGHGGRRITVFTERGQMHVPIRAIERFFPGLRSDFTYNGTINAVELAERLWSNISMLTNERSVRDAMHSIFRELQRADVYHSGLHLFVCNNLDRLLHSSGFRAFGGPLRRCRGRFISLAFFASFTGSWPLAEALIFFFIERGRDIVRHEQHSKLRNWLIALAELHRLCPPEALRKCFRILSHRADALFHFSHDIGLYTDPRYESALRLFNRYMSSDDFRGRGMMLTYPYGPRHRSLPPRPRYLPPLMLGPPPNYNEIGFPRPGVEDVAERVENIAERQHLLENKVDRMAQIML